MNRRSLVRAIAASAWMLTCVVSLHAQQVANIAPTPAVDNQLLPQVDLAPEVASLNSSPTPNHFVTQPTFSAGGNLPQVDVGQNKQEALGLPNYVQPGKPILEFQGSGMFGPHNYDHGDRWLDWGMMVQTEFLQNAPSTGESTEELFFRRLRPLIAGGLGDWQGVVQIDFGAGQNGTNPGTTIKWANVAYTGFDQAHVTFGSFKPWFSREHIASGPHLQTIERSFVGNINYGNPDYMLGVSFDKMTSNNKFAYFGSAGFQSHLPSVTEMQMRSPATPESNANQGALVTGRFDYYVLGHIPHDKRPLHAPAQVAYNRSDFHTQEWRMIVSTAMFGWWNDGDSNPFTSNRVSTSTTQADLQRAYGTEVSSGVRGFGISSDIEYQFIHGDLLVPTFTGGLYQNGQTDMDKLAVNTGYMFPKNVELVGAWSIIQATGFEKDLSETTVGLNWFVKKYAVRFAANYSLVDNMNGVPGNDIGVTRLLSQFVW
jgi:phosphate-selective porin OprO and OprP